MIPSLKIEQLRNVCGSAELKCDSSDQVEPLDAIIGQPRAVKALETGLGMDGKGYNIYVAGRNGTGKLTAVKRFLDNKAKEEGVPEDVCYVNNFHDSYCPQVITFPAGMAEKFRQDMRQLVIEVQQGLQHVFSSDEYANRQKEIVNEFKKEKDKLFSDLNDRVLEEGLMIRNTAVGVYTVPIKDNRAMTDEEFATLNKKDRDRIKKKQEKFQDEIKDVLREARKYDRQLNEYLHELQRNTALFAIESVVDELKENYKKMKEVSEYLEEVKNDVLDNIELFTGGGKEEEGMAGMDRWKHSPFSKYEVNVLVDNAQLEGAPVVIEENPNYTNLFGKVEKESYYGTLVTDFTLIRPGALHRANGGYLVIPARQVLSHPYSWDSLKRALRNRHIEIEDPSDMTGLFSTRTISPEPVSLNIKVLLLDERQLYSLLYHQDTDFRELFKIKADFDTMMPRDEEHIDAYIGFVCKVCREENLLQFDGTALGKLIEYSSRLADDQYKLSAYFGQITDIVRQASYYARDHGEKAVRDEHIRQAINEGFYRSNLLQVRINEMIENKTIRIDSEGEVVGQVNGLSVLDLGDIAFGRPTRITVSTGVGRDGLVDIERQAELGGPIHTKGVMILSGYLSQEFARDHPISLSASLVFEQNYSEIDGDSASSTELYALLSSLSGLPIKQGIAVTGSVNQKGEVQAIGGANEKIEGYYQVCATQGLTGDQGVIIPASNVRNLMLKEEILDAVHDGDFHIWAVETIDEGIEILTGVKAGIRNKDGSFTKDSVKDKVAQRLYEMAMSMKTFGTNNDKEKKKGRGSDASKRN